ncbi:MAG: opacity protein-like surface antigen [Flavobacteriales bacterium]|jgi:opacity protein-like surface antigen
MMKKFYTLAILGFLFTGFAASAQFVGPGRHSIAFGAFGNEMLVDLIDQKDIGSEKRTYLPGAYLNFDYSISKKFSLGFGLAGQLNTITGDQLDYTYTSTSFQAGIRPLYHFIAKKETDFYAGLQAGFIVQSVNLDNNTQEDFGTIDKGVSEATANLVVGVNTYLGKFLGINLEAAAGTTETYSLAIGFSFRW